MLEHREAGGRRLDAAARAHQEGRAEVVLELGDALADGRGLDVLLRRRAGHVLVVADRHQEAQGLEIDVSHGRDDARFCVSVPE